MRILLLAPNKRWKYNWGPHLFREELMRHHQTYVYGPGWHGVKRHKQVNAGIDGLHDVKEILSFFGDPDVDVIVTCGCGESGYIKGLDKIASIPKVSLMCDYFPRNYKTQDKFLRGGKFNMVLAAYKHSVVRLRNMKVVPWTYWLPHGVDLEAYPKLDLERKIAVLFIGSYNKYEYPNRAKIKRRLERLRPMMKISMRKIMHEVYAEELNKSIMAISSSDRYKSFNLRMTEIPACGALLISDQFEEMEKLGFIPGRNFVLYETLNQLRRRIDYYLKHPSERDKIAEEGQRFVREKHNNSVRVDRMTQILKATFKVG